MSRATISTGGTLFTTKPARSPEVLDSGGAMHIALLGDFSGRANTGRLQASELGSRRAIAIDRDNFEEVFESLGVSLQLPVVDQPLEFCEFDDLHPDFLYQRLPLFDDLRKLKRRLQKPDQFEAAAEEIRQWGSAGLQQETTPVVGEEGSPDTPPIMTDELFDSMLAQGTANDREGSVAHGIDRLIQGIVAPHVVKKADPSLPAMLDAVDEATCDLMRRLTHNSAFQQLEASWQAVYLLVRRLETDSRLRLFLVDVAREEIAQDLAGCDGDLQHSGLYKLLAGRNEVPGATPYAVINADYYVGADAGDMQLAAALAGIGEAIGATVCCGGRTELAGCDEISQSEDPADWRPPEDEALMSTWGELRGYSEAAHIALAAPRFLLRLPYGSKTYPLEQFAYEELPRNGEHRYYLWGNSAYLVTLLLAQGFQMEGRHTPPGRFNTVDDLPLHAYTDEDGDSTMKPCAEVLLTDSAATRLAQAGLLPVRSVRGRADVVIPEFSALAREETLSGPWS